MLNDPPHALLNTPTATAPLDPWDEVSIWTSEAWDEVSYNPAGVVECCTNSAVQCQEKLVSEKWTRRKLRLLILVQRSQKLASQKHYNSNHLFSTNFACHRIQCRPRWDLLIAYKPCCSLNTPWFVETTANHDAALYLEFLIADSFVHGRCIFRSSPSLEESKLYTYTYNSLSSVYDSLLQGSRECCEISSEQLHSPYPWQFTYIWIYEQDSGRQLPICRRAFSVAGPTVWNSLPDELREETENTFRLSLKTSLFRQY